MSYSVVRMVLGKMAKRRFSMNSAEDKTVGGSQDVVSHTTKVSAVWCADVQCCAGFRDDGAIFV